MPAMSSAVPESVGVVEGELALQRALPASNSLPAVRQAFRPSVISVCLKLLLHKLIGGERPAELLAVEHERIALYASRTRAAPIAPQAMLKCALEAPERWRCR